MGYNEQMQQTLAYIAAHLGETLTAKQLAE